MFESFKERATADGVRDGRRVSLPITARSVSRSEAVSRDRNIAFILGGISVLVLFFFLLNMAIDAIVEPNFDAESFQRIGALLGLVLVIGLAMSHSLATRREKYSDPQIEVDVMASGIIVRSPKGVEEIPFDRAAFDLRAISSEGSAHFVGIVLASRAGPLDMHDLTYKKGKDAAAAIVFKASEAGVKPRALC